MWTGLDIIPGSPDLVAANERHPDLAAALRELGQRYEEIGGVILVTPEFYDPGAFPVDGSDPLYEDHSHPGLENVGEVPARHWDGLPFLADTLQRTARQFGVPVALRETLLPVSAWAPLRLMFPTWVPMPLLPVGMTDLGPQNHYRFGLALRQAAIEAPKPIAILVATNLTQRQDMYSLDRQRLPREGRQFDETLLHAFETGNWEEFEQLDPVVRRKARPDQPDGRLWALIRGLSAGLKGDVLSYKETAGAWGMAVVHYEPPRQGSSAEDASVAA
ncbi:MAG: hypothetical protein D6761_10740 [Candidatus Dadabacteria bacterium]|nr:MAG: hypothetical protein D6761_10740 [Candidatus Dadabacteria bacterium]